MDADELYTETILDHFKHPKNAGIIENPSVVLDGGNPICGDQVGFTLEIVDGVVTGIKFQSKGCAISKAASSMVTELVLGKTIQEALQIPASEIFDQLGNIIQLRQKCALLPLHVVHEGLKSFVLTGQKNIPKITI